MPKMPKIVVFVVVFFFFFFFFFFVTLFSGQFLRNYYRYRLIHC